MTCVVIDTSVLINFLKINRLDLFRIPSLSFLVTDLVRAEITDHYPEQLQRFQNGLQQQMFKEISVSETAEIDLFLTLNGKLGLGECSAIAVAVHRNYALAIDDVVAIKNARIHAPHLQILRTQDLMVKLIQEGILNIAHADSILQDWAENHRFKLKIHSFKELLDL